MENPPSSSRSSNSDAPHAGVSPLVSLFDLHLRLLSDSYVAFFLERKKIEEIYVDSLTRLHRKASDIDAYMDDRSELSTTRRAWSEIRDNVEREAQTKLAFLATLNADILQPLISLRETQDRTRKRIVEDLKESTSAYNDYAENTLPRLKGRYLKKFQEVEEQRKVAAIPQPIPASTNLSSENYNTSLASSKSNPSLPARPMVTSPQPLRALDRRPSGSTPPVRNRSPSTSTAFSDLAHQGKKQLNQLIGFLDKGASGKDGLGGRSENALRNVRTKREADEADKEYRKAVHWLETLRLRRTKILEGGYQSLKMFVYESSSTLKRVLEKYTDNMAATTTTQTQLSGHGRLSVNKISPDKDIYKLASYLPRSLAEAIPDPIFYQHGKVGYCKDLIFGISLVDYATARGLQDGQIPKIIKLCIDEVDRRGLECEGIYRVSGRQAIVQALQHDIEREESVFAFNPQKDDVYAVSSLLKLYLRELPEPVFRYPLQDRIQHTEDRVEHQSNNFMLLRGKIRRLPPIHQATLRAVVEHLHRVSILSEKNKMDAKNLSIVFGGVIFGEDEMPKGGDLLSVQSWKDTVMEDLIINARTLYDDQPPHHSPPLPPTPAGEPIPTIAYGTQHTRVASMPGTPSTSPRIAPQDFTPRLPPWPANSIHPSLRAGPTPASPIRARADILPLRPHRVDNDPHSAPASPTVPRFEPELPTLPLDALGNMPISQDPAPPLSPRTMEHTISESNSDGSPRPPRSLRLSDEQ